MSTIQLTKYLTESIIDYVKNKNTNYALMINGDWGSGKTYFWNTVLRPTIEDIDYGVSEKKKIKTIYISLYGIKNIDEVNKKLSYELYASLLPKSKIKTAMNGNSMPEIAKTIFSVGGEIANQLSQKFLGIDFEKTIDDLKDVTSNINNLREGYVFCFDDLERTDISITETMGYLNNFVEHDNTKVIIICNEDEISKRSSNENKELKILATAFLMDKEKKFSNNTNSSTKTEKKKSKSNIEAIEDFNKKLYSKNNEYKTIKEKLIGKTLKYNSNLEEVITTMLNRIKDVTLKESLSQNKNLIANTLLKSGQNNIRILNQALNDFEFVHCKIKTNYASICFDDFKVIFVFLLAYSIELKTNQKSFDKLKNIQSRHHFEQELLMKEMFDEEGKEVFGNFQKKYFRDMGFYHGTFFKFVEIYVREGIFNEEIFNTEMDDLSQKLKTEKVPIYDLIINENYYKLTNEQFDKGINNTFEMIRSGDLPFYRYYHAYGFFKRFLEYGLFKLDESTMFEGFMNGLKQTVNKNQDLNQMQSEDLSNRLKKMTGGDENEQLAAIRKEIVRVHELLNARKVQSKSEELLNMINYDFRGFIEKLNEGYESIPIFKHCDINKLANYIFDLTNEEIAIFRNAILQRYENKYYRDKLADDFKHLKQLSELIENYKDNKDIQLNIHMLQVLNEAIKKSVPEVLTSINEVSE